MDTYLAELKRALAPLNPDEQSEVLAYYSEYLQDAQLKTYDECVKELGSSRSLARKILADYSIRTSDEEWETETGSGSGAKRVRHQVSSVWRMIVLIGLAILSSPVTIPVIILAITTLIALAGVAGAMVLTLAVLVVAALLVAVVMIVAGAGVILTTPFTGLFYIGAGLIIIGGFMMGLPVLEWAVMLIIRGVSKVVKRLYRKIRRPEKEGTHHEKNV
ncbi:DUF1700 domain-containing protein [Levilactobacillus bambusae]|uniref:DUF1700 domain-containing protein n=1 Tax=Levilactobacillus bambusae TaxID=2024736 RepID=A0A2V1N0L1_9LACO|nr:DUF1700 domain-containing protein [Levilactobacillus bambusae]PWG00553.1 hypothetical protein DCM90_06425 [Levilactobacillus bambusae]